MKSIGKLFLCLLGCAVASSCSTSPSSSQAPGTSSEVLASSSLPEFVSSDVSASDHTTSSESLEESFSSSEDSLESSESISSDIVESSSESSEEALSSSDSSSEMLNCDADYHWYGVDGEKEPHEWVETIVQEPTYETAGIKRTSCQICGYYEESRIPPIEHNYSSTYQHDMENHWRECLDPGYENLQADYERHSFEEEVVPSTYDDYGYTKLTCTVCDFVRFDDYVPPLEHVYSDSFSYDESSHWRECLDSGYESLRAEESPHSMQEKQVLPTYEEEGFTLHQCSVCGYSYKDAFVAKLEHQYSDAFSYDEAYHWHQCIDSGYQDLTADYDEHAFVSSSVAPTFEQSGLERTYCSICGYVSYEKVLEKLTHSFGDTYLNDDAGHWHACLDEGYENERLDYAEHCYDTEVIPATYENGGYTIFVCKECGYTKEGDFTEPLEHCFSPGYGYNEEGHFHPCMDPGYGDLTSPLEPHTFNSYIVDATFEHGSYEYFYCTVCQYSYQGEELLPALEHTYSTEWTADYYSHYHACTDEGYSYLGKDYEDHVFTEWVTDVEPTDYTTGSASRCCTVCGFVDTKTISSYSDASYYGFRAYSWDFEDKCTLIAQPEQLAGIKKIIVPETYYGKKVVKVQGIINVDAEEIVLPKGVEILSHTHDNPNLKKINLPDSLTTVSYSLFGCPNLEELTVPESVTSFLSVFGENFYAKRIRWNAINADTGRLTYSTYIDGGNYAYPVPSDCEVDFGPNVEAIPHRFLQDNEKITTLSLPQGVVSIGDSAFQGCPNLTYVSLSDPLETIGENAFCLCESLSILDFRGYDVDIGRGAFSNTDLRSLDLSNGVYRIGALAFDNCNSLAYAAVDAEIIEYAAFSGASLSRLELGPHVDSMSCGAILNCPVLYDLSWNARSLEFDYSYADQTIESLKRVTFGDSVTAINDFFYCPNLEAVSLGKAVSSIESFGGSRPLVVANSSQLSIVKGSNEYGGIAENALKVCQNLEDGYFIEEGVTYIKLSDDDTMLYSYSGESKTFTVPNFVTSIGDYAFRSSCVEELVISSDSTMSISTHAFDGLNLQKLTYDVPRLDGSWPYYQDWPALEEVTIGPNVISIPDCFCYGCSSLKKIVIPDNVERIGKNCFHSCEGLEELTVGENVSDIGNHSLAYLGTYRKLNWNAICCHWSTVNYDSPIPLEVNFGEKVSWIDFSASRVKEVFLPASFDMINGLGFRGWRDLESISVSEESPYLSSIDGVLYDKSGASLYKYPEAFPGEDGKASSFVVPNRVTYIAGYAFYQCYGLTRVDIPRSTKSFDYHAFSGCTNLSDIYFGGTAEEWEATNPGLWWESADWPTVHYAH